MNKIYYALSLLAFFTSSAMAGTVAGGGGKGVVCRNPDQSIRSVEVLDLWEARVLRKKPVVSPGADLTEMVEASLKNLSLSLDFQFGKIDGDNYLCKFQDCLLQDLREAAKKFLADDASVVRLSGVDLTLTDDSFELASPKGCAIEQVVNYQPAGGPILVNQDLVEKMDATNQAALIAHEAYYQVLRTYYGEADSLRTRRAVGFAFSGKSFVHLPSIEAKPGYFYCESETESRTLPFSPDHNYLVISPDFKEIDFATIEGTRLIGLNAAHREGTPVNLEKVIRDSCGGENPMGGQTANWTSFGGPVEFDRAIQLGYHCKNGRKEMFLTVRKPGKGQPKHFPITCNVK